MTVSIAATMFVLSTSLLLTCLVLSPASASPSPIFFDGGLTLTGLSAGGLAISSGTSSIALSSAGVALGAVGLLGVGVVKAVLLGSLLSRRGKRDTHQQLLQLDQYFSAVAESDIDDCGKKLVCDIKTRNGEVSR